MRGYANLTQPLTDLSKKNVSFDWTPSCDYTFKALNHSLTFTCNGRLVEQVPTFKYLGLHFRQSGSIANLITPIKSRAGDYWAAVQRRYSLLHSGNTINLHLQLLQAILVPVLQYGCQVWSMQSPRAAAASDARAAVQRLYDYYLRTICRLSPSTPRKPLLTELGLLPLQVFWW